MMTTHLRFHPNYSNWRLKVYKNPQAQLRSHNGVQAHHLQLIYGIHQNKKIAWFVLFQFYSYQQPLIYVIPVTPVLDASPSVDKFHG